MIEEFKKDLLEVLQRHYDLIAAFGFGVTYVEGGVLKLLSNTVVPIPPKDHEDEILRDVVAKKIGETVIDLTRNVYGPYMEGQ